MILDTRPLRGGDERHPGMAMARHRKPDLPVRPAALGPQPVLRCICHPQDEVNEPWLEGWRDVFVDWIRRGLRPHAMLHCPDNVHAPRLARRFHTLLIASLDVGELPAWPGERGQLSLI